MHAGACNHPGKDLAPKLLRVCRVFLVPLFNMIGRSMRIDENLLCSTNFSPPQGKQCLAIISLSETPNNHHPPNLHNATPYPSTTRTLSATKFWRCVWAAYGGEWRVWRDKKCQSITEKWNPWRSWSAGSVQPGCLKDLNDLNKSPGAGVTISNVCVCTNKTISLEGARCTFSHVQLVCSFVEPIIKGYLFWNISSWWHCWAIRIRSCAFRRFYFWSSFKHISNTN